MLVLAFVVCIVLQTLLYVWIPHPTLAVSHLTVKSFLLQVPTAKRRVRASPGRKSLKSESLVTTNDTTQPSPGSPY